MQFLLLLFARALLALQGANMCGACLKDQVDVTEDIPKKG
ncbi:unnamed protein product, partial [Laminaria digitata]